jgi:hypothetical protein
MLRLVDADGSTVDEVNYDDEGDWPTDDPHGPSIYLLPEHLSAEANDGGAHWARSENGTFGVRGAWSGGAYRQGDLGSPGLVIDRSE